MRVFFQRGQSQGERAYAEDLERTIRHGLSDQEAASVVKLVQQDSPADGKSISVFQTLFLWGGPSGIRSVFRHMEPGDLCLFLLDRQFRYAARIALPLRDLTETQSHRVSQVVWVKSDYHHIWVMDEAFPTETVWAEDASEFLGLGPKGLIGGKGAILYHSQVNLNYRPESWFADQCGGVLPFLAYLGLSDEERSKLLSEPG